MPPLLFSSTTSSNPLPFTRNATTPAPDVKVETSRGAHLAYWAKMLKILGHLRIQHHRRHRDGPRPYECMNMGCPSFRKTGNSNANSGSVDSNRRARRGRTDDIEDRCTLNKRLASGRPRESMESPPVFILRRDLRIEKITDHGVLLPKQRYQAPHIVVFVILNGFDVSGIGSVNAFCR